MAKKILESATTEGEAFLESLEPAVEQKEVGLQDPTKSIEDYSKQFKSSTKLNLFQRMLEVKKHVTYLQKEAEGFNYKYTSSSQVISSVRRKMNELGIMLVPEITNQRIENYKSVSPGSNGKPDKEKNMFFTELAMTYVWVNVDDPTDNIKVQWAGQGTDDFEKGIGKALTYAEKYLILKTFNIPTDKDDPDSFQIKEDRKEDKKEEKQNPKPQAVNLNSGIDRKAVIAMIMEMHEKNKDLASTYLESATGKRNIKDVTDAELEKAMVKIRADHHKFVVAQL